MHPNEADLNIEQGKIYLQNGDYQLAVSSFTKAISLSPANARAYYGRGLAFYLLEEYNSTIADSTNAIKIDSQYVLPYISRGKAHYYQKEYNFAIADYASAIEIDPADLTLYFSRGMIYDELGDYHSAIADYTQALKIDPNNAEIYTRRGQSFAELGDFQTAIDDYTKAIKIDQSSAITYYNRGLSYHNLKDSHSAIADYSKAIRVNPDDVLAYLDRGSIHIDLGDFHSAIADYTQVIRIDPNNARAYMNRGYANAKLKNYHFAITDYTGVIKIDSKSVVAYFNRGAEYLNLKDYLPSIADSTSAINIDPKYTNAYINRGVAYTKINDYDSAIRDLNQALQLDSKQAVIFRHKGEAYISLEIYDLAISNFTQAIDIDPNDASTYYNRAISYSALKEYQLAIEDFTRAINRRLNYTNAYLNRGVAYSNMGNEKYAIIDYNTILEYDPSFALAHHNRGMSYYYLKEYHLAIANYTTAIEYFQQPNLTYYYRGAAHEALLDFAQAQANYIRYIFIGNYDNTKALDLLRFFDDHADAPFIVKRFANLSFGLHQLQSYRSFLLRMEERSQSTHDFLDFLVMHKWSEQQPEKYQYLSALCHYFMGDAAEAFRIFDEQIDDHFGPLGLMSHYYFVQFAIHSAWSESDVENLRKEALKAAVATLNANQTIDLLDYYYAGLIYYQYGEDNEQAILCFRNAKGLLPALYMLWLAAPPQQRWPIAQAIIQRESSLPVEKSFGKGLVPRPIGREFAAYWGAMQHYCFYHEIALAIQGIHAADVATKHSEFYIYWQFQLTAAELIKLKIFQKAKISEKILQGLDETIISMKELVRSQTLETTLKDSAFTILEVFESLQSQADKCSSKELEKRLASHIFTSSLMEQYETLHIVGFDFFETHQKLALYFYITGKIDARAVVNLMLYTIYTAKRFNSRLLRTITRHSFVEGMIDDIKDSDTLKGYGVFLAQGVSTAFACAWGTTLGIFLIGFSLKALLTVIDEVVLNKEKRLPAGLDFQKFLQDLDKQLTLIKEKEGNIPGLNSILN